MRDLFTFQMYTGLAYSDSQAFDFSRYRMVDGKWINTSERVKTGVPYVSSLLPPAIRVLERYGWQVPKIDNADYNHLKAIGTMAGTSCTPTAIRSPHTCSGRALRWRTSSGCLGHKNIRQTMRYAKVLAESVHEDYAMVAEKMKK